MARAPGCPVCRGRLNKDGTCPFVSSHENILRMRIRQGSEQSDRMKGKGTTSLARLREMSKKAVEKRKKKK